MSDIIPKKTNHAPLSGGATHRLRLFIVGNEPNSIKACQNLEQFCARHIAGRSEIVIIDVTEDFQAALDAGVLVAPTLIVDAPSPQKMLIGTLNDEAKMFEALGISVEAP